MKYSLSRLKCGFAAAVLGTTLFTVPEGIAYAQVGRGTLNVVGAPRPVLQAAIELTKRYGYVITYEDPKYVYAGDMKDVTQQRRDLSRFPAGRAPRTYELIGGSLTFTLPNSTEIDESTMYTLLAQLLRSWFDSSIGGGHFQVRQQDGLFHIEPTEVRDRNGNWQSTKSVLGMPISLPTESRDDWQTYKVIGRAVSALVGVKIITLVNGGIVLGGAPTTKQYVLGAQSEPASSVLARAFKLMKGRRTWYLLYEPTLQAYVLNIDDVPDHSNVRPIRSTTISPTSTPHAPTSIPSGQNSGTKRPQCVPSGITPPCGS